MTKTHSVIPQGFKHGAKSTHSVGTNFYRAYRGHIEMITYIGSLPMLLPDNLQPMDEYNIRHVILNKEGRVDEISQGTLNDFWDTDPTVAIVKAKKYLAQYLAALETHAS